MDSNFNSIKKYDIFNFLDEHTVIPGQIHTHTSMNNPKGSYFIKSSELDIFYELYKEAIFNDIDLHITEKHEEISPMIIDLDFKFEVDTPERKHTEKHIKKIVQLYIEEICNLFNIEIDDKKLTSFVFERNEIYKCKGIKKDGVHIMFPFIISYSNAQFYIRDNILKKIGEIINELQFKNTIAEVVDRCILLPNSSWLLYESNKSIPEVKNNRYKLKYIYDENAELIPFETYFQDENINLSRFFSIREKNESDLISVKEDKLPILEINKKKTLKKKSINPINYNPEKIKELVSILNEIRSDNYSQWLEVGWALHNIDPNSQELLDIWIEFSMKSPKFKDGVCEKEWERSKNEGLTIACLHYWAKIDNRKKYIEFLDKDIDKYIDISIKTQSNYDIALVLFKMNEYDFKYSDNEWYIFKNHIWHREMDGMSLRQKISTELVKKYANLMTFYNKVISNHEVSDEEKEEYKKKNIVVLEVIKKLKTTAFKENVMKECKELFCDKEFIKKIDTNPYLLGFANGVYDLKKGELRDGRPDDYMEMSTDIDKIDFDDSHECWSDLKNFLETTFVDEEVRSYFLTYMASCLQGHNAEEKFRIWTGIGCHAFNTEITMFDGTLKKVQNIITGDKLMGDDLTERNVIQLIRGKSDMYKFYGDSFDEFIVNGEHILCLTKENNNTILEVSVRNFLNFQKKEDYYLYNTDRKLFKFNIINADDGNFYGFELDNNNRYIMGNGIVTHNSNGKSKILELFVHSLGNYAIKFPITMLTGKRAQSNACTPEIVQSKGKRFGYFEEPSENERINAGLLKEFTGGDKIKARALHKEPIEFKPQFKLALLCNEMPEVPPNDSGTWRRMEVIEFKSRFCDNPKENHEFPIDKQLSEKLRNWKELFMALLLDNYYAKYRYNIENGQNGIKVPMEVIKFTLEYQKQCDLYTDFITEILDETKENNDFMDITQLYDEFKVWYQDVFNNNKIPSKVEFKKYLEKRYTKKRVTSSGLRGFKFKVKFDKKNPNNINNNINVNIFQENEVQLQTMSGY